MRLKSKNTNSMFVKFEKIGDSCEGTFVEFNEGVPSKFGEENNLVLKGPSGPLMIRCQKKLTAIIKDNLESFQRGSRVRIEYIADIDTGKGNPMKDFDVDVDPPTASTLAEMRSEGQAADNIPF